MWRYLAVTGAFIVWLMRQILQLLGAMLGIFNPRIDNTTDTQAKREKSDEEEQQPSTSGNVFDAMSETTKDPPVKIEERTESTQTQPELNVQVEAEENTSPRPRKQRRRPYVAPSPYASYQRSTGQQSDDYVGILPVNVGESTDGHESDPEPPMLTPMVTPPETPMVTPPETFPENSPEISPDTSLETFPGSPLETSLETSPETSPDLFSIPGPSRRKDKTD